MEKVLEHLRVKAEREYEKLEKEFSVQKLKEYFSDENTSEKRLDLESAQAEDLMMMAYTQIDAIEEKQAIMPRALFFLETCKIILDTLRSNSKLLEFYNDTARKVFNFCRKYNARKEFRKISETLHNHFNQIVKHDKMIEI